MSYDIDLIDPKTKKPVKVENHEEGGTYVLGGTEEASLNVTYNYSKHFYAHLDSEKGIRWLYGKTGEQVQERLAKAITELGTVSDSDYWRDTPGNAGHALLILLNWAVQHPTAVFKGD